MTMTAFTGSIKNQARLETLLNRAHALLAENRIESARILMEQALALGGSSELADLCGTLEKVVLPAEAKSALDEADRRRSLGDMDGAEANLHRAAELAPSSLRAGNALGWFLAERDQLAQAQVVFMELARKHHDVAEAHANLAAILIRRGQQDRAEESLWNVLRLEPDHVDAMLALMNSFAGKGEETAALELAKRFLSAAPDHPAAGTVRAFMATRGAAMTAPTNPIPGNPVSEWFAGQQQQAIDSFFALLSDEDSHRDLAISLQRSVDLIHAALKDPRAREAWRMLFSVAKAAQEGGCFAVSRLFCKKILEGNRNTGLPANCLARRTDTIRSSTRTKSSKRSFAATAPSIDGSWKWAPSTASTTATSDVSTRPTAGPASPSSRYAKISNAYSTRTRAAAYIASEQPPPAHRNTVSVQRKTIDLVRQEAKPCRDGWIELGSSLRRRNNGTHGTPSRTESSDAANPCRSNQPATCEFLEVTCPPSKPTSETSTVRTGKMASSRKFFRGYPSAMGCSSKSVLGTGNT